MSINRAYLICLIYIKGGNGYFCGRICSHDEGTLDAHIPLTIPETFELVEFFCLPVSRSNRRELVKKVDIKPYNAVMKGNGQRSLGDCNSEWSPSYIDNMRHVLNEKYKSSTAETLLTKILDTARKFLRLAMCCRFLIRIL